MRKRFSVLIAVVAVAFGIIGCLPEAQADTNVVPDASFRACLNSNLGQSADASITASQLQRVSGGVSCGHDQLPGVPNSDISSIEGAQYLTGITSLYLSGNPISDISPLSGLVGLSMLDISDTQVSDLSALSGTAKMETLSIMNDPVTSIGPLNGMVNLQALFMDNTQVTDLSPLTGLTSLRTLMLGTLPTNDVSVPASLKAGWGTDMDNLTVTTQVGASLNLPTYNMDCPLDAPCPSGPMRTWTVQSGDVTIDGYDANVMSAGTAVLTWVDSSWGATVPFASGTLTVKVRPSCEGFTDVLVSDWFHDPVCWFADNGLTNGTNPAGTTFNPNAAVTRGQEAAFLYRLAGSPSLSLPATSPFTDVDSSDGFYKEIVWLQQQGLTNGTNAAVPMFSPYAAVTRGQMAAFLYRMAGSPSVNLPATSPFTDVAMANGFYKEIVWLQQQKITTGTNPAGTTFSPNAVVTRGQVAAFLQRFASTMSQCTTYTDAIGC